jgi:hypothetical protein
MSEILRSNRANSATVDAWSPPITSCRISVDGEIIGYATSAGVWAESAKFQHPYPLCVGDHTDVNETDVAEMLFLPWNRVHPTRVEPQLFLTLAKEFGLVKTATETAIETATETA